MYEEPRLQRQRQGRQVAMRFRRLIVGKNYDLLLVLVPQGATSCLDLLWLDDGGPRIVAAKRLRISAAHPFESSSRNGASRITRSSSRCGGSRQVTSYCLFQIEEAPGGALFVVGVVCLVVRLVGIDRAQEVWEDPLRHIEGVAAAHMPVTAY
jgi:hypothetical protein